MYRLPVVVVNGRFELFDVLRQMRNLSVDMLFDLVEGYKKSRSAKKKRP
jgi:hypothetical protein